MAQNYATLDYVAEVQRYAPDANADVVGAIKRYCGIALQNRDSALVAGSDKEERMRVVNNFLKKKLGMTDDDATLDAMVVDVCNVMKADRDKLRVTVYYLLAAKLDKLSVFTKS